MHLLKNDAFFPQEITRTSQTYRRQNQSACPACCAFLSRRARLPWHAQKMCAVTIVGTVLKSPISQVMPNTSVKVFFGTKTWVGSAPQNFCWGATPPAPPALLPMKATSYCVYSKWNYRCHLKLSAITSLFQNKYYKISVSSQEHGTIVCIF